MTLNNAIEECCAKLKTKNWSKIVNDCPKLMNAEQRENAIKTIEEMPENLKQLKEDLNEGMALIKSLRNSNPKLENSEIKRNIQKIMEINSMLQKSLEAKILGMYNAEIGYTVAMSAYRVKEDTKSDVDDIVKMCEMSYKGYLQAIENMQKSCYIKFFQSGNFNLFEIMIIHSGKKNHNHKAEQCCKHLLFSVEQPVSFFFICPHIACRGHHNKSDYN